ncbi:MAG: response regulator transcription factor [Phycisphaerales bacterium]
MSTTILLVDDHRILREGLRSLLERQSDMEIVGEAGDGRTALRLVRELRPEVVIMDVNMESMDGIDATRAIIRERPGTRVLALSMYLRKTFVSEMFKSGASGYLLKENAFGEVVQAINTIMTGQRYACAKVAGLLVDECLQAGAAVPAKAGLTERETEVIRMLANGRASKEIALASRTSVKTVDACRRRIMRKLGISSVAGLVKYAIREGLTEVDG